MKVMGWLGILLLGFQTLNPLRRRRIADRTAPDVPTQQFHFINQMRNATRRIRE